MVFMERGETLMCPCCIHKHVYDVSSQIPHSSVLYKPCQQSISGQSMRSSHFCLRTCLLLITDMTMFLYNTFWSKRIAVYKILFTKKGNLSLYLDRYLYLSINRIYLFYRYLSQVIIIYIHKSTHRVTKKLHKFLSVTPKFRQLDNGN